MTALAGRWMLKFGPDVEGLWLLALLVVAQSVAAAHWLRRQLNQDEA